MGSRLRTLGILGAIVVLAGIVMVGSAFAILGVLAASEANCTTDCSATYENAGNNTIVATFLWSFGVAVGAAGAALLLAATVQFMDRWPPRPSELLARDPEVPAPVPDERRAAPPGRGPP